ncbi:MAG: hypothetical protein FWF25_02095 [Propionibacteriaceae bacterium]|nr:hypothetical protein [Propionibacteriaceae bacterium]
MGVRPKVVALSSTARRAYCQDNVACHGFDWWNWSDKSVFEGRLTLAWMHRLTITVVSAM